MKIGLLGLSNPCPKEKVDMVYDKLIKKHEVVVSDIVSRESTPYNRASIWNEWMKDGSFDYVFDLSGGDLANLTLPYLDLELYASNKTIYAGYSDCTVILDSLYTITKKPCMLYQIKDSIYDFEDKTLFDFDFVHTDQKISGIVVGGNIRCLLKLAGTPYFPDCKDKILFLESMSGNVNRIKTYFAQLSMIETCKDIKGILLGQFSELDASNLDDVLYECVKYWNVPVFRTRQIGHSHDSKALWIGKEIKL